MLLSVSTYRWLLRFYRYGMVGLFWLNLSCKTIYTVTEHICKEYRCIYKGWFTRESLCSRSSRGPPPHTELFLLCFANPWLVLAGFIIYFANQRNTNSNRKQVQLMSPDNFAVQSYFGLIGSCLIFSKYKRYKRLFIKMYKKSLCFCYATLYY